MQYEPIKMSLGSFFDRSVFLRKTLYFLLDLLLLRTWHVKKVLGKIAGEFSGAADILDAGSGFGQYTWRMSRMNSKWKIMAVDINRDQVNNCNRFFDKAGESGRVTFEILDLTKLNHNERYNIILSVDVMEHIEDDLTVFCNFFYAMKNNGVLIISTPSDKGGSDVHDDTQESFIDEHVRDGYSIDDISQKLRSAGFKDIKASYTYGKPGNISWRLSMKYPIKMLNKSRMFFILLPFYYLVTFPFAIIFNTLDLLITHKSGTGLLVTARKQA
jgi:SAM-dependent methyltransferase